MQVKIYASMQVLSIRICNYASNQEYMYASMQVCMYVSM